MRYDEIILIFSNATMILSITGFIDVFLFGLGRFICPLFTDGEKGDRNGIFRTEETGKTPKGQGSDI